MGVLLHAVGVVIHEILEDDWGIGGEQASKKLKDVQLP